MLGFGPFCLDLGHIAWIWAIWQNLGQNRPQRRQSPEDGAGGDVRRDVGQGHAGHAMACPVVGTLKLLGHQSREQEEEKKEEEEEEEEKEKDEAQKKKKIKKEKKK